MSGSLLDELDEVFTKIDSLGDQIQKVAYAVILLGEKQNIRESSNTLVVN